MTKAKIRIKNYRCFGHEPQEIEIGSGFTAFVGLNNAGKSATLKLFYELRPIWTQLSHAPNLVVMGLSQQQEVGTSGLQDSAEIFNHFNNQPIELVFVLNDPKGKEVEFGFRITQRERTTNITITGLGLKIDGTEIELIHSGRVNGARYEVAHREVVPNSGGVRQIVFIDVNFIAEFFKELKESIYIPSFRNVINVGENTNHYDIATGTAFIKQWDEWKTGHHKFEKEQIIKITNDIRDLFGYKNLEINASADKKTLWLTIDGKPYSMLEVGSGLSQFVLTFATAAIRKPTYIFIDEPELSLHPALQLKFLTSLGSYASSGVIFATHSLGLARSAEKVFSVVSNSRESKVRPFTNTPDYATLLGELSFSAYREIGADCILFVEGITEVRTMQEMLRKFGKDNKALIMSLGGSDMINGKREAEISEVTHRVGVKKIYAWIDSEKESENDSLKKERQEFVEVCKKLGIDCGVSDRRATENYFTQRALTATFGGENKKELEPYEKPDSAANWSKDENWKVARETTFDEIKDTDLGKFIENINK